MKYIGILRQEGGCDYTIGCGINTVLFEAENAIQAAKKLQGIIKESYNSNESMLKSANFYQINESYEVDLKIWYQQFSQEKESILEREKREYELAEYERLKKKYNL
jgi:excinuclease UvrABC ATPase subunit